MLKPSAFINIQSWMVTELDLSGNELFCYAVIHGFCIDGSSAYYGGYQYLAEWLNIDVRSIIRVVNRLITRGLIEKQQQVINGVITNFFKTVEPQPIQQPSPQVTPQQESLSVEPEKENNEDRTLEIQFNTFWNAFPSTRKAGKTKPKQKFMQIIKSKKATAEQLIKAAEDYAKTDDVARGFAKEPYSWLLNERYLCDYSKTRALSESEKRTQQAYEVYAEFLAQD